MTDPGIVLTTRKNVVDVVIHGGPVRDVGLRTGVMLPVVLNVTRYFIGANTKYDEV